MRARARPGEKNCENGNPICGLGSYSDCGPNRGTGARASKLSAGIQRFQR